MADQKKVYGTDWKPFSGIDRQSTTERLEKSRQSRVQGFGGSGLNSPIVKKRWVPGEDSARYVEEHFSPESAHGVDNVVKREDLPSSVMGLLHLSEIMKPPAGTTAGTTTHHGGKTTRSRSPHQITGRGGSLGDQENKFSDDTKKQELKSTDLTGLAGIPSSAISFTINKLGADNIAVTTPRNQAARGNLQYYTGFKGNNNDNSGGLSKFVAGSGMRLPTNRAAVSRRRNCDVNSFHTPLMYAFQRELETLASNYNNDHSTNSGVEVKTFFDLRDYDISDLHEKPGTRNPGPLRCYYLFYARLYEKLLEKQKGKDLKVLRNTIQEFIDDQPGGGVMNDEQEETSKKPMNDKNRVDNFNGIVPDRRFPLNLEYPKIIRVDIGNTRKLGMRELLDFTSDLGIRPLKLGTREIERCYFAAYQDGKATQDEAFNKNPGLTYNEFKKFLVYCADIAEENNHDKLSMRDNNCSRIQRVKKICSMLNLQNIKKVKSMLLDIWRDKHFCRLSEDTDFTKVAKTLAQTCIPKIRIKPLKESLTEAVDIPSCCKYLDRYTWIDEGYLWESFPLPYVDMGITRVGETKSFKLVITNRCYHLMTFSVTPQNCGPLRLPISDDALYHGIPCGTSTTILIEPFPNEAGEFAGRLQVHAETKSGEVFDINVPMYMRFVFPDPPREKDGEIGRNYASMENGSNQSMMYGKSMKSMTATMTSGKSMSQSQRRRDPTRISSTMEVDTARMGHTNTRTKSARQKKVTEINMPTSFEDASYLNEKERKAALDLERRARIQRGLYESSSSSDDDQEIRKARERDIKDPSPIDITRKLPYFAPKPFNHLNEYNDPRRPINFKRELQLDPKSNFNMIPRTPNLYAGKTNL